MQLIPVGLEKRRIGLLAGLLFGLAAMLASGVARAAPDSCNGEISPNRQNLGGPKGDDGQPAGPEDRQGLLDRYGRDLCLRQHQHHRPEGLAGIQRAGGERQPGQFLGEEHHRRERRHPESGHRQGALRQPGRRPHHLSLRRQSKQRPRPECGCQPGARGPLPDHDDRWVGPCGIPTKKAGGKDIDAAWSNNGATQLPIPGYPANDYFYQYGPLFGDMRCSNPDDPDDKSLVLWKVSDPVRELGPAPIRSSNRGISATRSWACPMAARFSSSATRARRCPRRPRGHACSGSSAIRGRSTPRPPRAPRPIRRPERPGDVGGRGLTGSFFLKWVHRHFGNGGGGNGGGGNGGGGGGGGSGGDDVTCASKVTVGANYPGA